MSSPTNTPTTLSNFPRTAQVRVASPWQWLRPNYKSVHVLVSNRICWKVANEDTANEPQSFDDFRHIDSLELVRLGDGTCNDVDNYVTVNYHNGTPHITVRGRPHGRTRRKNEFFAHNLSVEIIADAQEQFAVLLNQIRARIVPWNLLE